MSYIEAEFISRQEYDASEPSRLMEGDLTPSELHVAVFALAENKKGVEAAKLPLKLHEIRQQDSGLYIARLALMNADLKPKVECTAQFMNGHWVDVKTQVHISGIPTEQCYVMPYRDGLGGEWAALAATVPVPNRELLLV